MRIRFLANAAAGGVMVASFAHAGPTVRASVDADGQEASQEVFTRLAISADGRSMAFATDAPLVPEDVNGLTDVYVRDLDSGATILVSVSSAGMLGDGPSSNPVISGDGRRVLFASTAANLVDNDSNGFVDLFVRDLDTGVTVRVNVSSTGAESDAEASLASSLAISSNGRFVVFPSSATTLVPQTNWGFHQLYLHDLDTQTTEMVSLSNLQIAAFGSSQSVGGVSADGRWIAFQSSASNLHPDVGPNNGPRVYVRDRQLGLTSLVSVNGSGDFDAYAPSISDDGRYIAYSTLTDAISTDTNFRRDTYVWDNHIPHTITRATVGTNGQESEVDCIEGRISGDGRHVVFASKASEFSQTYIENTYQVFVRDLDEQSTSLVSKSTQGSIALAHSRGASISSDGRYVGFYSEASNLVLNDGNGARDAFVHDRAAASPGCPGDVDGDGLIGFGDLNTLLASFNTSAGDPGFNPSADFDGDLDVDFADLNVVLSAFNQPC